MRKNWHCIAKKWGKMGKLIDRLLFRNRIRIALPALASTKVYRRSNADAKKKKTFFKNHFPKPHRPKSQKTDAILSMSRRCCQPVRIGWTASTKLVPGYKPRLN
jgi:hypothetical protein